MLTYDPLMMFSVGASGPAPVGALCANTVVAVASAENQADSLDPPTTAEAEADSDPAQEPKKETGTACGKGACQV